MSRPSRDETFMAVAREIAKRSTCGRRQVGCVVTDSMGRILSTGYNGVPPGIEHCTEHPCPGSSSPSGTDLDKCQATHAEINALLFCGDITRVDTIYVTVLPCMQCVKAILTTSCKRLVFGQLYSKEHDETVVVMLHERGITIQMNSYIGA